MPDQKPPRPFTLNSWVGSLILALLIGLLPACSSDDPDLKPQPPLAVRSTSPAQGAVGVPAGIAVGAVFSREVDGTTVDRSTFSMARDGSPVPGTVAASGAIAQFVPDSMLVGGATYTATLTTGIADGQGNRLSASVAWEFTTAEIDGAPPVVSSTSPGDAAEDVSVYANVIAVFSESIDPESVSTASFSLMQAGTPVAGVASADSATVAFVPAGPFDPATTYMATLTTGIADESGNTLEADHVWSFTTGRADEDAPATVGTSPADAAQSVPLSAVITVFFSEDVDPVTVNETTFTVADGSGPVAGTVVAVQASATFTPAAALAPSTDYTVTLGTGIRDRSGNPLQSEKVWSFATTDQQDQTAPSVQGTTPSPDAPDVALGATVSATFSEPIDPASLTGATFRLVGAAGAVPGSFEFGGDEVTFTPAVPLAGGVTHTATLTAGITDLAGNGLEAQYSWQFTTVVSQDTTPPTIVSTFPVDGAPDTPVNTPIFATFSESIAPGTVSDVTFFVTQPGFPFDFLAPGTATVDGATASFVPEIPLEFARTYTATLTADITDLSGNPLAATFTWEFVTEAFQDQTAPTVLSTLPPAGAPGVSLTPQILGNFDENIDPSTVNPTTFTLRSAGGPVAGTVYGGGGIAFFEPDDDLLLETEYTAELTTGIKDYAGNALASPYTWTFTTGLDQPPVAVAGQDQEVEPWESVTLDGSRSFSGSGDFIVDHVWTKVSGPAEVPSVLYGPVVQFYAPGEVSGVAFDLVVNDGRNDSAPQRIEVFVLEKGSGIYVSPGGSDSNLGNRLFPKRTIAAALHDAELLGTDVYVAGGAYAEGIELRSGVSIYGGFEPGNWVHRDKSGFASVISSPGNLGARGIDVSDIRLDGLSIEASAAGGTELETNSSIGMMLLNARDIDIRGCQIAAGEGAAGPDGARGDDGVESRAAGSGDTGSCDDPEFNAYGGEGYGLGGDGGRGGGSWYDPRKAGSFYTDTWFGGDDGESGTTPSQPGLVGFCLPNGGKGKETWDCDSKSGTDGRYGCNGRDGAPGAGGTGLGTFVVGPATVGYRPGAGSDGTYGFYGTGGGGGGGSSGQGDFSLFCLGGSGNAGGGGGNGGYPGEEGAGGGGGGASIALALFNSGNVTVRESTLISRQGGAGGSGGAGGMGGTGGEGGLGGSECVDEVGRGGDGGPGGNGGDGGPGGGGGGGPSVGVVVVSSTISIYPSTVTQVGVPGYGGTSPYAVGANGLAGAIYDLTAFAEFEPGP